MGSFGINGHVKLPGPCQNQPNVYEFGTPYKAIYEDLRAKDEAFYEHKGLLQVSRGPADQPAVLAAGNHSQLCTWPVISNLLSVLPAKALLLLQQAIQVGTLGNADAEKEHECEACSTALAGQ